MSQKLGLTEDGFARIAEAAARQRKRETATDAALQPTALRYASVEEVARDFYKREDGKVLDRRAHRVWEMKARPGGGFDLIRAQDERLDEGEGEALDAHAPDSPDGPTSLSARLQKAASRGARYRAQMAPPMAPVAQDDGVGEPMEPEAQMPAEMPAAPMTAQACSCGGACQCDCGCAATGTCVCVEGCPCECGCGATTAQAVPAAQAPAVTQPPAMTAGLRDVVETQEDRRLAGFKRGTKVLVRIGKRAVEKGKLLARTATHFDVLLDSGATTRVLQRDVAPDGPAAAQSIARQASVSKQAVDEKARDYWESYFKEYGRQLVKSDLPRAVTDRAEPATPAGKQKTPTKSAALAAVGDVVDIGNIWMASKGLRTGVVKVVKAGTERLAVQDPFGGKMLVPRKAVVAVLDAHAFTTARKGGLNRAGIIQMASAALSWGQIDARYHKAAEKIRLARRWLSIGVRIALAKGAVPVPTASALAGRAAAAADWNPKLRKRALDEMGKSYYRAYWGDYGEDLIKEVRRRVKADVIDRKIGRGATAPARTPAPAPRTAAPAAPRPKDLRASLADALTAHVGGIMKQGGAEGRYFVDPKTIEVTSSTREQNRRIIEGKFTGRYTGPDKQATARKSFEMIVENGRVKAVKITG